MCGRYTLRTPVAELAEAFGLPEVPSLEPRYNIAPTQPVATVLVVTGERQLRRMRWGLIPSWARDPSIGQRLINARAETLAQKPAFRAALRQRRCLILADGFYEWARRGRGKQPYYILRRDERPFAFAGLWERWQPPEGGEPIESCTIITTQANELVAAFHERMPVILEEPDIALWLDPAVTDAQRLGPLLRPCPAERMKAYPVGPQVNRPSADTAAVTRPLPGLP